MSAGEEGRDPVRRIAVEEFLGEVLEAVSGVAPELRERLLRALRAPPTSRPRELEEVFRDAGRG